MGPRDLEVARRITSLSPTLWKSILAASMQRFHERELGLKTDFSEIRGKRACVDIVRRVARSKKTNADGARLLLANACNAVWTLTRAAEAGYDLESTTCSLCGEHDDTIHHRIWCCSHPTVKKASEEAVPASVIQAAAKAGPYSVLYNRGIFAHPEQVWPTPAQDVQCRRPGH